MGINIGVPKYNALAHMPTFDTDPVQSFRGPKLIGSKGATAGDLYRYFQDAVLDARNSRDKAVRDNYAEINQFLDDLNCHPDRVRSSEELTARAQRLIKKGVQPTNVVHTPILTSLSQQYANEDFIGMDLLPAVPVNTKSAEYYVYPQGERHAFPDDQMATSSKARTITETRTKDNIAAKLYGLHNEVFSETLQEQTEPLDEMVDATDAVNEGLAFKREIRHAALMQLASNYSATNQFPLGAGAKWDVPGSNPVADIKAALAALWMGRGASAKVAWCGREVWDVLCQHPAILEIFKFVEGGLATPAMFARIFGLDGMLVGSARKDTSNEGQATRVFERIWGNNFGVCRVATRPSLRSATFANTFRVAGDPVTTTWFDPTEGKSGTFNVKVAMDEDYKVVAADTGSLIINPLT